MKMKGTSSVKILASYCLTLLLFSSASAQLVEFPIGSQSKTTARHNHSSRTMGSPLNLPFWDDFSYADSIQENLWQFGKSVLVNNGVGIKPPSKNVATFDGADSVGKPYNVNNALARGLADNLVSQPIRMDLVDPALRSTVFLSFYYELKGNGELPDTGDQLLVSLLNSDNKWETVYVLENNDSIPTGVFSQVIIPIADDRFYHNAFQFRIQNFARLSGPYDTWNIDYIYLNSGRSIHDTSYPDRTVSSSLTSMFVDYFAMPIKHFLQNPTGNLKKPSLDLYNLRAGNLQPFDYTTNATVTTKIGTQITTTKIPLDAAQDPGTILTGLQFLNLTLNKIPPVSAFDPSADFIGIKFKFGMSTKDNVLPSQNGDYDPARYSPIDFRFNDSTRANYVLSSYYAYDDSTAEYGAGLNQSGSYVALKFLMKSSQPDTLVYVDIYFPEFDDHTNQSLLLQVRSNLTDAASSILYQNTIQVERSAQNKFAHYKLDPGVVVKGDFYVGWKQLSSASIPVGLDKNTDNGSKIYYNTNGSWVQNVIVIGSMMVHPGFGRPNGIGQVTGLETQTHAPIYPNPTSRVCYLPAGAENVFVLDITGRRIDTELQQFSDSMSLTFLSPVSGLVIVRYFLNGKFYTEKVMVRAE